MKALTLHQPWATLVAIGVKSIETRSWPTKYRGPLAIHAGTRRLHHGRWFLLARDARRLGAIDAETEAMLRDMAVPFGAVVATCRLVACRRIVHRYVDPPDETPFLSGDTEGHFFQPVPESELPFGDFSLGRFAWLFADIVPVDPPVPAKGRQRLWRWAPDDAHVHPRRHLEPRSHDGYGGAAVHSHSAPWWQA